MRGKIVSFPSYITNLRDNAEEIFERTLARKSVFYWLNHVRIVSLSLTTSKFGSRACELRLQKQTLLCGSRNRWS